MCVNNSQQLQSYKPNLFLNTPEPPELCLILKNNKSISYFDKTFGCSDFEHREQKRSSTRYLFRGAGKSLFEEPEEDFDPFCEDP